MTDPERDYVLHEAEHLGDTHPHDVPGSTPVLGDRQLVLTERLALYLARLALTTRVPDTAELAHRFHASQAEVHAALTELRRRHFLRAGHGGLLHRGDLIHLHLTWAPPHQTAPLLQRKGWNLAIRGLQVDRRVPPADVADTLDLGARQRAVRIARLVVAEDDLAARAISWLHPRHADPLIEHLTRTEFLPLLDLPAPDAVPIILTDLRVEIRPASRQTARQLRLAGQPPTPEVVLIHRLVDGAPLAQSTVCIHPQYFRLTFSLPTS